MQTQSVHSLEALGRAGKTRCFYRPSIARPCSAKSRQARPTELVLLLPSPSRAWRAVRGGEGWGTGAGTRPTQASGPARPRPRGPAPPSRPRPAPWQAHSFPEEASRTQAVVHGCRLRLPKGVWCVNSIVVNQVVSVSFRSLTVDSLVKGVSLLGAY